MLKLAPRESWTGSAFVEIPLFSFGHVSTVPWISQTLIMLQRLLVKVPLRTVWPELCLMRQNGGGRVSILETKKHLKEVVVDLLESPC